MTDSLSAEIGNNVVAVLGFNAQTVDTAHYLTAQGKKVTIVSDEPEEAFGTGQSMMLTSSWSRSSWRQVAACDPRAS